MPERNPVDTSEIFPAGNLEAIQGRTSGKNLGRIPEIITLEVIHKASA